MGWNSSFPFRILSVHVRPNQSFQTKKIDTERPSASTTTSSNDVGLWRIKPLTASFPLISDCPIIQISKVSNSTISSIKEVAHPSSVFSWNSMHFPWLKLQKINDNDNNMCGNVDRWWPIFDVFHVWSRHFVACNVSQDDILRQSNRSTLGTCISLKAPNHSLRSTRNRHHNQSWLSNSLTRMEKASLSSRSLWNCVITTHLQSCLSKHVCVEQQTLQENRCSFIVSRCWLWWTELVVPHELRLWQNSGFHAMVASDHRLFLTINTVDKSWWIFSQFQF